MSLSTSDLLFYLIIPYGDFRRIKLRSNCNNTHVAAFWCNVQIVPIKISALHQLESWYYFRTTGFGDSRKKVPNKQGPVFWLPFKSKTYDILQSSACMSIIRGFNADVSFSCINTDQFDAVPVCRWFLSWFCENLQVNIYEFY